MVFKEFVELVEKRKRKDPVLFELDRDKIPSDADIDQMEDYYCLKFPESYMAFLKKYGGGYFAYTVVYSCDADSTFYLLKNVEKEWVDTYGLFPVIDLETGDLGVFKVDDRVCEDQVYIFVHSEENARLHGGCGFLQALVEHGLKG